MRSTNIKPVSYLKTNAAEMLKHLAVLREPLLIAQNGEPTFRYLGMNGVMDLNGGKI